LSDLYANVQDGVCTLSFFEPAILAVLMDEVNFSKNNQDRLVISSAFAYVCADLLGVRLKKLVYITEATVTVML
jgi:hypothetical protein